MYTEGCGNLSAELPTDEHQVYNIENVSLKLKTERNATKHENNAKLPIIAPITLFIKWQLYCTVHIDVRGCHMLVHLNVRIDENELDACISNTYHTINFICTGTVSI